jgi:hypothetical protein
MEMFHSNIEMWRTIDALAKLTAGGTSIHLLGALGDHSHGASSPSESVGEHSFKSKRCGPFLFKVN